MAPRIDRITIAVNDMPAMIQFYDFTFDTQLRPLEPDSEFVFYIGHLGNLQLFFCPNEITQIEAVKNRQQLRVVVEDIEKTVREAVAAGGQALGDIQHAEDAIAAGVSDPDGNSIELIQYL